MGNREKANHGWVEFNQNAELPSYFKEEGDSTPGDENVTTSEQLTVFEKEGAATKEISIEFSEESIKSPELSIADPVIPDDVSCGHSVYYGECACCRKWENAIPTEQVINRGNKGSDPDCSLCNGSSSIRRES